MRLALWTYFLAVLRRKGSGIRRESHLLCICCSSMRLGLWYLGRVSWWNLASCCWKIDTLEARLEGWWKHFYCSVGYQTFWGNFWIEKVMELLHLQEYLLDLVLRMWQQVCCGTKSLSIDWFWSSFRTHHCRHSYRYLFRSVDWEDIACTISIYRCIWSFLLNLDIWKHIMFLGYISFLRYCIGWLPSRSVRASILQ